MSAQTMGSTILVAIVAALVSLGGTVVIGAVHGSTASAATQAKTATQVAALTDRVTSLESARATDEDKLNHIDQHLQDLSTEIDRALARLKR